MSSPRINVPNESTTDIKIPLLTRTNLVQTGKGPAANGRPGFETRYSLANAAEPQHPFEVRAGWYPTSSGGQNWSIALYAWAREDNGDLEAPLWEGQAVVTIAVQVPTPAGAVDSADMLALISNAFSLWFQTLTAEVPDLGVINSWAIKNPSVFNDGH